MNDKEIFRLNVSMNKSFSYLEYHTDQIIKVSAPDTYYTSYSFIKKIEIDNDTDTSYDDLVIHFEFSNPIFSANDLHTGVINARNGDTHKYVLPVNPNIQVDAQKLYELVGIDTCTINIEVRDPNDEDRLLANFTRTIQINPIRQASDNINNVPELYAKYCVTGFPELDQIQHMAEEENDNKPLLGYQNGEDKASIIKEIACIYRALHKCGISYTNPLSSTEEVQNVRLPQEVLKAKTGTCLDLALLFCSALLHINLCPILVLIDGHAFAGCFLNEYDHFNAFVETRPNTVYTSSVGEDRKLILFECTNIRADSDIPFTQSVEMGAESLRAYRGAIFSATDIYRCQQYVFKPIPIPASNGELDFTIHPVEMKQEQLDELNQYQSEPISDISAEDRFTTWEKKLLDLSTANRLVDFKGSKNNANNCKIIIGTGKSLYDYLVAHPGKIKLKQFAPFFDKKQNLDEAVLLDAAISQLENGIIYGYSDKATLKNLIRKDKMSREETGSPTLYLSFGMISAQDEGPNKKVKQISAPFLLLPITLSKDRIGEDYTLTFDMEDLIVNKTFFEYYSIKKGADYSSIYSYGSSYKYEDIVETLRKLYGNDASLSIDENLCFIANFSFSHMVMWQDIVSRKETLSTNAVIKSLLKNTSFINNEPIEVSHIDELDNPLEFAAPLPYDSTQLKAIRECAKGNSFILDGPPGTGKSQTIVNMIVNAFYNGKTVLFVAEKQAALEVVRQRLHTLDMDKFALQLYSTNASKASLFKQVGEVMDLGPQTNKEDFQAKCEELNLRKENLNQELKNLHAHNGLFYSLYEAITRKLSTSHVQNKFTLDMDYCRNYTREKDENIRTTINSLKLMLEELQFHSAKTKNLAPLELTHLSLAEQAQIGPDFASLNTALTDFETSYLSFARQVNLSETPSEKELLSYLCFYEYLLLKKVKLETLINPALFEKGEEVIASLNAAKEYKAIVEKLSPKYNGEQLLAVDGKAVLDEFTNAKGLFGKLKAKKNQMDLLSPLFKGKTKLSNEEITSLANDAITAKEKYDTYHQNRIILNDFFQGDILKSTTSFEDMLSTYQDTYALYQKIANGEILSYAPLCENALRLSSFTLLGLKKQFSLTLDLFHTYQKKLTEVKEKYPFTLFAQEDYFTTYEGFYNAVSEPENIRTIYDKANVNKLCVSLKENGLTKYAEKIIHDEIPLEELESTYEYALSNSFIMCCFSQENQFNNTFNEADYKNEIKKYETLIQEYSQICVAETIQRVTSRFEDPDIKRSSNSPVGALRKLVSSSGKGITIRNTLSRYEDLLRVYFPCYLMSPLAAAQYLSVDSKKFDIVIFDEASQIPTSEAVGPIARGNSLIVAGDPQQMPPTNFFNMSVSNTDDDLTGEAAENEDAESLLDDCISIGMPRIRLAFHYRSRHESLIKFSNMNFYGGDLFTFPSKDNRTSHVSFLYVEAKNKAKSGDISEEEINAIRNVLKSYLDDSRYDKKSIGIIVFNTRQQEVLYDEVDRFINSNPKYVEKTHWNEDESTEKLFVKNLENVQGDERDIILMSIGFTKNVGNGKANINGPLALDKGERRLNVAASRAKEQMIVISTIHGTDIDETGKKNQGAKHLKDFLLFAENNTALAEKEIIDSPNKDLAFFIAKELKNNGYECDIGVGSSEFKVDLAIRKPDTNDYLLGVLLDEKPLNSNISCRDRFYVEPSMLTNLKWKIIRVYTYTFLRFPKDTIQTILKEITSTDIDETFTTDEPISSLLTDRRKEGKSIDYGVVDYKPYLLAPKDYINYDSLEEGYYYQNITELVERIVACEGPVSLDRIKDLLKLSFGIRQAPNRATKIMLAQIENASIQKDLDYNSKIFYVSKDKTFNVEHYRRNENRDIMDVSKYEILALMNKIIEVQHEIDHFDLIKATAEQMGITTITSRVRGKLEYVINFALTNHLFKEGYKETY